MRDEARMWSNDFLLEEEEEEVDGRSAKHDWERAFEIGAEESNAEFDSDPWDDDLEDL